MNHCFLRILLSLVAFSGHALWCVHSAEGSWFDGMEFEEYHPPKNDNDDKKIPLQTAYRIPCGIMQDSTTSDVIPLSTLVDLNLSTSTITESFLQSTFEKDELANLMIPADDDLTNNGTKPMIIPSGSLWLRMGSSKATVLAPTLRVITKDDIGNDPIRDDSIQLKLGMDLMDMYQGRLDVDGAGGLVIMVKNQNDNGNEEVLIPVWRPRSPMHHHEDL